MKTISRVFLGLMTCLSFSQNKQLLYGFSEIPQSVMQNPGVQIQNKGYFGIPFLSHIHVNVGTSGITPYDLFAKDGMAFSDKVENAVNKMKSTDFFTFNQQLELISGGFAFGNGYEKNKYISFGLYQETDFLMYFPKDIAVLALQGNLNHINKPFRFNHINFRAEILSVFHVGYNKKASSKLTYGIRGKIYSSIININATKNAGSFLTTQGTNNFYNHHIDLNLLLQTSGINSSDSGDSNFTSTDIRKRLLLGGNLGLGFDVGFTYQLKPQWTIDASLLDIGMIRHSKDVKSYNIEGHYDFEGINPFFPEINSAQTAEDYWNEVIQSFENVTTIDSTSTAYTTWRPLKFNSSLNYAFGKKNDKECNCLIDDIGYQNAIGIQLYAINRPKQPQFAVTAYYYRRLFKNLRLKATYTADSYSLNNLGLGISTHFGGFNFYAMADNFLEYNNIFNAHSISLQLGFNYIFSKNEN